jgi:uncharacterized protein YndB with AHSA1/START domain
MTSAQAPAGTPLPPGTPAPTTLTFPSDVELRLTRTFDAPPELVWTAWTEPRRLARWWGPLGFTLTTTGMDVRPGGQWRFVMHGPDGRDYPNLVTYLEVERPHRLVYKHGDPSPDAGVEPVSFTVTATFDPVAPGAGAGERTRVTLSMVFPSKERRDFVIKEYGADEGGKQTLARLAEHLGEAQRTAAGDPSAGFVISRVFTAPRELVWKAWTQQEYLMKWFGPKGATMARASLDLRPGGTFHYCMRLANGTELWGLWVFRDVTPPDRLVFVNSFADSAGKPARSPFDPAWPLTWLSTVSFAEHAGKGGGTVVNIHWDPVNATDEERRVFMAGHESMRGGWSSTLERLAEFLWDRC